MIALIKVALSNTAMYMSLHRRVEACTVTADMHKTFCTSCLKIHGKVCNDLEMLDVRCIRKLPIVL